MPIHRLLERSAFVPDDIKVVVAAFECACQRLDLQPGDPRREQMAHKVFECAQRGERSPERLEQAALGGSE